MSRIHEALKKAEQERAASQPDASLVGGIPLGQDMPMNAASRMESSPPLSGHFTFDALLARCPQTIWHPDEKTMLFFGSEDHAPGMEEFRTLRSRLYQLREKQPLNKVLVTSALPKEGKSFTSANLAQVIVRQHGKRVLLIDADLRGPRLHLMLGTPAR